MDDLLSEFLTETSESISTLDVALVNLEQNPNDPQILGNIFRLVHTIKGTCGFLGLPRLEHVAHAGENVRRSGATPSTVRASLACPPVQLGQAVPVLAYKFGQSFKGLGWRENTRGH